MKNLSDNIILYILLLLFASCTEELQLVSVEKNNTTTVNLRFSTRATMDADIEDNEGIKTLRVILLDANWNILQNIYQSGLDNIPETTVTLKNVPKQQVRFLVMANEESMGRSFDTSSLMQDMSQRGGLKEIFNRAWEDASRSNFPKMAEKIEMYGLPMTGVKGATDVQLEEDENGHHDYNDKLYEDGGLVDLTNASALPQTIDIPLVRCVAKLVVNVTNKMDENLEVSSVRFGRFFSNKTYYYAHNPFHMPYETGIYYHIFELPQEVTITQNDKKTVFTGYIYPVSLPNDNNNYRYSISLKSNILSTSNYQVFLNKTSSLTGETTEIGRNKKAIINCTVDVDGLQVDLENLNLVVQHWDDKTGMGITFD